MLILGLAAHFFLLLICLGIHFQMEKIFLMRNIFLRLEIEYLENATQKKRAASDIEIDGVFRINNSWNKKGLAQKKRREMNDNSLKNS